MKARVRRLQRQLAMGQIRKVVPKANVVITNLTHYAVALQYDSVARRRAVCGGERHR